MIRELRGYDPKPGLRFGGAAAQAVAPDLFVRRIAKGWADEVNGSTLPRLLVNRRYHAELARGAAAKSKAWLSEKPAGDHGRVSVVERQIGGEASRERGDCLGTLRGLGYGLKKKKKR